MVKFNFSLSKFKGKTAFGHDFRALHSETKEKKNLEFMFKGIIQPLTFIFGQAWTKVPTEFQKQLKQATMASEKVREICSSLIITARC